jgi:hypothetical protein
MVSIYFPESCPNLSLVYLPVQEFQVVCGVIRHEALGANFLADLDDPAQVCFRLVSGEGHLF